MDKPPDTKEPDSDAPVVSHELLGQRPFAAICEAVFPLPEVGDDRHPVDVLADEFSARCRAGEKPSIDEYETRAPQYRALIRSLFPTIAMIERMTQQSHHKKKRQPRPLPHQKVIGDFQIIREIGRGGMGIVYEAIQRSLERKVALKVLGSGISNSPAQLQRFRREAESVARLHHTNIVPVYGIGEEDEIHFYAMQFIDGIPLAGAIETARHRLSGDDTSHARELSSGDDHTKSIGLANGDSSFVDLSEIPNPDQTLLMQAESRQNLSAELVSSQNDILPDRNGLTGRQNGFASDPKFTIRGDHSSDVVDEDRQDSPLEWNSAVMDANSVRAFGVFFENSNSANYFRQIALWGVQVADGLHYAHQHGVLHRDIKPSNLMLDRNGSVWIMDFGLVKVLERNDITQVGEIVGTLRYMAPEQLDGRADARTDVYGLGLTLFELLTFRPAFDGEQQVALAQRLQQGDIPRPRTINPSIPRDLETIVLKATSPDPAARYATAAMMAEDLKRFRDDRPILARRINFWERFWRWSRRNPALAAAAGSIVVLLAMIAVVATIGRLNVESALRESRSSQHRAESNLDSAINAFDSILDNVTSRGLPRSLAYNIPQAEVGLTQTPLSAADAVLLDRLLEFYRNFSSQNADNQRLRARIAQAHQRAAAILVRLGRLSEAEADLRTAVFLQQTILKNDPQNIEAIVNSAAIYNDIGELSLRRGEFGETFVSHLEARALILEQPESVRLNPLVRFELARATDLFASIDVRSGTNEGPRAPPNFGSRDRPPPFEHAERQGRGGPPDREHYRGASDPPRDFAGPNDGPGRPLPEAVKRGRDQSEIERLRKAIPRSDAESPNPIVGLSGALLEACNEFRALSTEFPDNLEYALRLAQCLRHRLVHAASGDDPVVARDSFIEAVKILDQLVQRAPNEPKYQVELADTLTQASRAQSGEEPAQSLQRAVEISEQLSARFPTASEYQLLLGTALARQAAVQAAGAQQDEAEAGLRRSIKILESLADQFPDQGVIQIPLAKSSQQLGDLLRTTSARAAESEHPDLSNDHNELDPWTKQRLEGSRIVLQSAIDRFRHYLSAAEITTGNQKKGRFNARTLTNLYASLEQTLTQLRLPEEAQQARKNAESHRRPGPPRPN